jgi:hypothetical protein
VRARSAGSIHAAAAAAAAVPLTRTSEPSITQGKELSMGSSASSVGPTGTGLAATTVAVGLLAACSGPADLGRPSDATPPSRPTVETPVAPLPPADVAPVDAGTALVATRHPLSDSILPSGFEYRDSVPVDDGTPAVSNVYGGPDGPTGSTIYVYSGIGADYTTPRQAGLAWTTEAGFGDGYVVRSADDGGSWAFVDVDATGAADASVQIVGRGVPRAVLRDMALRLLAP